MIELMMFTKKGKREPSVRCNSVPASNRVRFCRHQRTGFNRSDGSSGTGASMIGSRL